MRLHPAFFTLLGFFCFGAFAYFAANVQEEKVVLPAKAHDVAIKALCNKFFGGEIAAIPRGNFTAARHIQIKEFKDNLEYLDRSAEKLYKELNGDLDLVAWITASHNTHDDEEKRKNELDIFLETHPKIKQEWNTYPNNQKGEIQELLLSTRAYFEHAHACFRKLKMQEK